MTKTDEVIIDALIKSDFTREEAIEQINLMSDKDKDLFLEDLRNV